MKKIFSVVDKVAGVLDKAVVDKDQRIRVALEITTMLMQSEVAKYVRAVLAVIIIIGIMFFGDKLTISEEIQKYCLYSVLGYYFLDRVFGAIKKDKR